MSAPAAAGDVSDAELIDAIERWAGTAVPGAGSSPPAVVELRRRPWEYATSAPLELVKALLDDGSRVECVLKHLSPRALSAQARRVKPAFVLVPHREPEVYRRLLAPRGLGPRLIGSGVSAERGVYWLLTEKVRGCEMYQVGDVGLWCAAARWLKRLHQQFETADVERLTREASLIEYDRRWYEGWMERAQRFFAATAPPRSKSSRSALQWLAERYDRVVDRLVSLPRTVIHGEFYPSNVLVMDGEPRGRVCPVDWEMTAAAPGIIDLAALTLGPWAKDDRRAVIAAYVNDGTAPGTAPHEAADTVELAQIHLCVQWLGWFGRRRGPAEHSLDWLSEAVERAERLRL